MTARIKPTLTYERVNELLRYDPATGKMYWKVRRQRIKQGAEAGSTVKSKYHRTQYRQVGIDGKVYLSHRVAWLLHYGVWPDTGIDHWDGNGLKNLSSNLREASKKENGRNARMRRDNTSGFTGVHWYKDAKKWRARIQISNKEKHLGYFTDINDAKAAYEDAKVMNGFTERHGRDL